jgi:RNA polymerase sigma-70 factor (ECF subfamily)
MLSELPHDSPGAEQVIEQTEAISLAFITALQLLSPRARAVLVMRDVLGFSAREVADTLETTPEAVNMSLSRARASIQKNSPSAGDISAAGREQAELAQRLAGALAAHDIDAVVGLLAEDVRISMPPLPAVWDGRRNAVLFLTEVAFRLVPEARFVPTQANGQPALAVYTRDEINGRWHASGILVITLRGNEIAALTRFETHTLRPFGLPRVLLDH